MSSTTTTALNTPEGIAFARLCTLKAMLKLEILGMRRSKSPSAYVILKTELGLKGSREVVLAEVQRRVDAVLGQ